MKNTKKIFQYAWPYLQRYWLSFFGVFFLFGAGIVMGNTVAPVYVKRLTDTLQTGATDAAISVMVTILILYILMRVFFYFAMIILSDYQSKLARDLHAVSYKFFTHHSYHFYKDQFTGSLVSKSARLGDNMIRIIDAFLFNFFTIIVTVAAMLVVLFGESITIGLVFIVFLLLYFSLIFWMNKRMGPYYESRSRAKSRLTGVVSDIITNIQTILFFGNSHLDKALFDKANQHFYTERRKAWMRAVNHQDVIGFIPPLFTAGITFYAIYLVSQGVFSTGSVILVFLLGNNLNVYMWGIGGAMKRFVSDVSDTIEAIEIIETPVQVYDVENPEPFNPQNGVVNLDHVSFSYPKGEHVFDEFTLNIPSGQSVGIVGKSGSGKTTITKLLLRLYDLDAGTISIGGQDISQVAQDDLRRNIAYIPQDTILFHRTILQNIAYGNPDASEEEVMEAARRAHVDEFAQNLEHGYQTKVGERGVKLSGGQRQRIGIARAMLKKDAPILVMDEATSSLDSMSEQYIQESFEDLSQNRTTIVIAHRLSTIQKMDRIIVMDQGKIIEDGSHEELLAQGGHYAELWNSQVDGFIPDN